MSSAGEVLDAQITLLLKADAAHDLALSEDDTTLAAHEDRIAELEAWRSAHNAYTLEQEARITALEARVDETAAVVAILVDADMGMDARVAALEEWRASLGPTLPSSVPWFTHVENMSASEVEADMSSFGASGVFMYKPFAGERLVTHLDHFRALGKVAWFQVTPPPDNWTEAKVRAILDYATPDERAHMIWCHGQEQQGNVDPADYPAHVARQSELFALVHEYGCLTGYHGECWMLNPSNKDDWAGETNFAAMLGDVTQLDVLALSCMDFNQNDSGPEQVQRALDVWAARCPGSRFMVTSIGFTVPTGTPLDDPKRVERADAVSSLLTFLRDATPCSGYGAFSFTGYDGRDSDVSSDPLYRQVVADFTARLI